MRVAVTLGVVAAAVLNAGVAHASFAITSFARGNFVVDGEVTRCTFVALPRLRISDYPAGKTDYALYDAKAKEQADSLFRFETWSDAKPVMWQGFGGYARLMLRVPAANGISATVRVDVDGRDITSLFKMDSPSGDWLYPSAGPRGSAPILDAVVAAAVLRARVYNAAGQLIATQTFDVADFNNVAPALKVAKWTCRPAAAMPAPRPVAPPAPPAPPAAPKPGATVKQLPN